MKKEERILQLKQDAEAIIDKAIQEQRDMTDEELDNVTNLEETIKQLREQSEEVEDEEPKKEEPQSEEEPKEEEPKVEDEEDNNERSFNTSMKKEERNFSLVKAIRAIANNQQMDDFTAAGFMFPGRCSKC